MPLVTRVQRWGKSPEYALVRHLRAVGAIPGPGDRRGRPHVDHGCRPARASSSQSVNTKQSVGNFRVRLWTRRFKDRAGIQLHGSQRIRVADA